MTEFIKDFFEKDEAKIEKIIRDYPQTIPVEIVAELFGINKSSVRNAAEAGCFGGISWRAPGALNKAYKIPTAPFVRYYLGMCERGVKGK